MSEKAIEVRKRGSGWFVFVRGAPIVKLSGKLWFDRAVAGVPTDGSQPPIPIGTKPHRFGSKSEADGIAAQVGMYVLKLGQFAYTYIRHTSEKPNGEIVETPE